MTPSPECMYDCAPPDPLNDQVTIGNGTCLDIACFGKLDLTFESPRGVFDVTLDNVAYVPDLSVNLFSLTAALHEGEVIIRNGEATLYNGN